MNRPERDIRPEWDRPTYPAAEAGRLVGLTATRVRRWLQGYSYIYEDRRRRQRPVIQQTATSGTSYASFLDLVDLLFVKRFLDHGVSLQRLRKALAEASQILGTSHFARRTFFTDGRNVYLEVKKKGEAILQLLSGGQWVIAPIIEELATQIDFDDPSGFAKRWYPSGFGRLIVLDPLIAFGSPSITKRGITTANVHDFFLAEDENVNAAADWLNLKHVEVEAAVQFEQGIHR